MGFADFDRSFGLFQHDVPPNLLQSNGCRAFAGTLPDEAND